MKRKRYVQNGKAGQRCLSIILVIAMSVLLLAGCGSSAQSDSKNPSKGSQTGNQTTASINKDCIYRDELLSVELPMENVYRMSCGGDKLYMLGYDYDEATGTSSTVIASCKLDGSEMTEIVRISDDSETTEIVQTSDDAAAESDSGWSVSGMQADDEGNVYLMMEKWSYSPESMMGSYISSNSTYRVVKLDSQGNELWSTDIETEMYLDGIVCAGDKVLVNASSEVVVLDSDGRQTGSITISGMDWIYQVFAAADGKAFVYGYVSGQGYKVMEIDAEKGTAGEALDVSWASGGYNLMSGYGYDIFLWDSTMVAGYNIGDAEYTEVLNFIDSDIDSGNIDSFAAVGEGKFLMTAYNQDTWEQEIYVLSKVAPEDVKDKQVLTLGGLYISNSDLISDIVRFNKSNDEYRVTLKDYSKYNTEAAPEGGITQLNNDVTAGNMPDILIVDNYNMPMSSYIQKGVFEDLYTWLDNDGEMSREDFLSNVLEAFSVDGKLYQFPIGFSIGTAVGKTSVVGDRTSWNYSELKAVTDRYPDSSVFDLVSRSELLTACAMYFGDSYIDPYEGTCDFNSEEFIELLKWTAEFPAEIDYDSLDEDYWMNEYSRYRENEVLLYLTTLYGFGDLKQTKDYYFGEDISLVGFPVSEGNGSVLMSDTSMAISAKSSNKDGAWEFIKYFLTEEYQSDDNRWCFPVRSDVLEAQAKKATEPDYYLDENGNKVEYENTIGINGTVITIYPMTEEEADEYLQFIRSVDKTVFYNEELVEIIMEESEGFFAGGKTAEATAEVIQRRASLYMSENQ